MIAENAQLAAPYLKEAEPLRLGRPPDFDSTREPPAIKQVDNHGRLTPLAAVGRELKRPVGVKFTLEERAPAAKRPAPTTPPAARRNLMDDPLVTKTVEMFAGKVYDIRE